MASFSDKQPVAPAVPRKSVEFLTRDFWVSMAITVIWIAVAIASIWGADFVSSTPGASTTTIPSGIGVAMFASIATWALAKHALHHDNEDKH